MALFAVTESSLGSSILRFAFLSEDRVSKIGLVIMWLIDLL